MLGSRLEQVQAALSAKIQEKINSEVCPSNSIFSGGLGSEVILQ
jgi:hypothetical protein